MPLTEDTADTPADDALRAAVERVERALSRFEATRIADLDWPTKVSVDPADLRLLLPALLTAAEQVAGLRETILSAANICEHWADESRNGGWSTHQVEPNRRLAASLRKAALGAAP